MENNTQPRFYFSAYPLKVIGTTASTDLIVNKPKPEAFVNHLRILPTIDKAATKKIEAAIIPYTDSVFNAEHHHIDWYNNYE
ncbi:MAG TPA: hypothetical protein VIQ00_12325 [Chitinophagaceae bacterium]